MSFRRYHEVLVRCTWFKFHGIQVNSSIMDEGAPVKKQAPYRLKAQFDLNGTPPDQLEVIDVDFEMK